MTKQFDEAVAQVRGGNRIRFHRCDACFRLVEEYGWRPGYGGDWVVCPFCGTPQLAKLAGMQLAAKCNG